MITLKDGDKVTLDGTEMDVTGLSHGGYWLKACGRGSYFWMQFKSKAELEELYRDGRLKIGKLLKTEPGREYCMFHKWRKYVGIREVYSFCEYCGEKQFKDWREIKNDREY